MLLQLSSLASCCCHSSGEEVPQGLEGYTIKVKQASQRGLDILISQLSKPHLYFLKPSFLISPRNP
eukprot:1160534-Pelagomonas_calceolata.AAC.18